MAGKRKFRRAHKDLDVRKANEITPIPGILGFPINGVNLVEVRNRNGYVYVRLRDNQSEVVQAFNTNVSPVYGLPVLIARDKVNKSRYIVLSRDLGRYENWGTSSPYLPRHGAQHSFDPLAIGGDIVWIYNRQFMPLNVYPSGSFGSMNVLISPGTYYRNSIWHYAGGTGTASFSGYKPTGSSARMVLVYLDDNDNPQLTGGTFFASNLTGTNQIYSYIPNLPVTSGLPLAGIRLVSGTSIITWDNIYDVRPFIVGDGFIPTGTSGHIIANEGSPLTNRPTLDFIGANVWAIDNAGSNKTDIIISGSAVGGGSLPDKEVGFGNGTAIISEQRLRYNSSVHGLTIGRSTGSWAGGLDIWGMEDDLGNYVSSQIFLEAWRNTTGTAGNNLITPSIVARAGRGKNIYEISAPGVLAGDKLFGLYTRGTPEASYEFMGASIESFAEANWSISLPNLYSPSYLIFKVGSSGTVALETAHEVMKLRDHQAIVNGGLNVSGTINIKGFILNVNPINGRVLTSDANGVGTWQPATGGTGTVTNLDDLADVSVPSPIIGQVLTYTDNGLGQSPTWQAQNPSTGTSSSAYTHTYKQIELEDEFGSGGTAAGAIGSLGWTIIGNGAAGQLEGERNHPGLLQIRSGIAQTNLASVVFTSTTQAGFIDANDFERATFILRQVAPVSGTFWRAGLGITWNAAANLGTDGAYVEYNSVSGTTLSFYTRGSNSQQSTVMTGVSGVAGNWLNIEIVHATGTASYECWVNGILRATHSSILPTGTVNVGMMIWNISGSSQKELNWDYFSLKSLPFGQRWT